MRKVIVSLLLLATGTELFAQTNPYSISLPQLLPPSPEPALFVKSGVGNANLSTGALTTRIPLYDIKVKNYTFPISLSYSTQGLKVDEASSRVGYGWVLNATGMISRVVKGQPDELTTLLTPPADLNANTNQVYSYLFNASDPNNNSVDSQQDEFQFNVNGYSGKFVLDANDVPRVTANANIKIGLTSGLSVITATTPDGVKYSFGTAYEKTTTHNIGQYAVYKTTTKTAFFLDRIDLPTGDYIIFHYSPIHTRVAAGISQVLQIDKTTGAYCSVCSQMTRYTSQLNIIEYDTQYLESISTSTGLNMVFSYEQRKDLSGDNRLKSLFISGLKQYLFDYYDVPATNVTTGRFFLTNIQDININGNVEPDVAHNYVMTYDQMDQTPLPQSFSQDYLGYYNGKGNSDLIPPAYNSGGTAMNFSYRDPNWEYAKKGTLIALQYPTGGREEYTYEANTVSQLVNNTSCTDVSAEGIGGAGGTARKIRPASDLSPSFDQSVTINFYCADANLSDGYTEDPSHRTVIVTVYEGSTAIGSRSSLGYSNGSLTVNLLAGHTYFVEMTVYDSRNIGYCSLRYNCTTTSGLANVPVPGVRVRQIRYYDPITTSTHSKYYTYSTLNNPSVSTGSCPSINFKSSAQAKLYCDPNKAYPVICNLELYSSNTTQDVYNLSSSGSLMYYKTVVESDAPDFSNGGTEYTFYNNDDGGNHMPLLGQDVPYLPTGQAPTLSGVLFTTKHFDKNKQVVKEEQDDYETLIDMSNAVSSIYVRRRYETAFAENDWQNSFDVVKITYSNNWIRLKTKTTKEYMGNVVMTQKTDYSYGDWSNVQPSVVTTLDSKGNEIKSEKKYPTDFSSIDAYAKLVSKNVISAPVQETNSRNGTLLQQQNTTYKDWFNDGKIVLPDTIKVKQSPVGTLRNALVYEQYDATGNPVQFRKTGDVYNTYIWGYKGQYPVAKIIGADYNTAKQYVDLNFLDNASLYSDDQIRSNLNNLRASLPGALVYTYTYKLFIGTTSETDPSGKTTYYEYDGFGRLKLVRDKDGNIIKKFCYTYQGVAGACSN